MSKSVKLRNNIFLDSTSIVHGRTKLSDILNYSTNKIAVGKALNGKTIYKQSFRGYGKDGINIGNISNFGELIKYEGSMLSVYRQWWGIPNYHAESNYYTAVFIDTSGKVNLSCGTFFNTNESIYNITIYYTEK